MASAALTAWDEWVDSQRLDEKLRALLKSRGEELYLAAIGESALHIRKHLLAVEADANEVSARKETAATVRGWLEEMPVERSLPGAIVESIEAMEGRG